MRLRDTRPRGTADSRCGTEVVAGAGDGQAACAPIVRARRNLAVRHVNAVWEGVGGRVPAATLAS
jgi:hypothetical protein